MLIFIANYVVQFQQAQHSSFISRNSQHLPARDLPDPKIPQTNPLILTSTRSEILRNRPYKLHNLISIIKIVITVKVIIRLC